ncbi:NifU family protein [Winogradskyella undariae]|uniref:NifU family protein n=1 Tax=Winogradskyella TaxID=286104 RepID=UPI00156AAC52|nr:MULTISPECIES: NifU family protein [Winogradskyella]NRR90886.1 NifU family protein [Winogradskyella undariae]QNK77308.1 NifU family protein [Winogradskyella sp. PAMC22761]QXP80140.1 NifU family protein [Winogradskyella sp. HaHa_3_26]
MLETKISVVSTSNDAIKKFEADRFLTNHNSFEFNNIDDAKNSPLAQQLFYLPFVKKVYIASNFIAIERYNIVEWKDVENEVALQIEEYLSKNEVVVIEDTSKPKAAVTIYAESTPNPGVLKFVCNKVLVPNLYEFKSIEEAKPSPLATALFQFPFVKNIYMEKNFVSITKFDIIEWEEVTLQLREFLKSYVEDGKTILNDDAPKKLEKTEKAIEQKFEALDDTSKNIINILEEYIKPAVESDGGNIEFISYDETSKEVKVLLQGACSGCPSSTFTLKNGIESMLKEMLNDNSIIVNAING